MDRKIRSFIAIDPAPAVQSELAAYAQKLHEGLTHGFRWVNPHLFHLTFKFLGDVPEKRIITISDALNNIVQGSKPFTMWLDETGAYPSWQSPRTVWIGSSKNDALDAFHLRLESGLGMIGFPAEKRRFSGHLTLCRVTDHANRESIKILENKIKTTKIPASLEWQIGEIILYQSTLTPRGPEYSVLSKHKFESTSKV